MDQRSYTDKVQPLKTFLRALDRESHVLQQHPYMLWQQLYNRLQWEGDEIEKLLEPEYSLRCKPGAAPWIRSRTRSPESGALIRTLAGHSADIYACAFSPDSRLIVTAGSDGALRVWDAASGALSQILEGHLFEVYDCNFSPDGRTIVSAGHGDYTLRLWEIASGREIHILDSQEIAFNACCYSPCGRYILAATNQKTLIVWGVASGEVLHTLVGHTSAVNDCAISPDGSTLLSASLDGTLRFWDAADGQEQRFLEGHEDSVNACAFSPGIHSIRRSLSLLTSISSTRKFVTVSTSSASTL